MKENLPILCIDFDDVIVKSKPIFERYFEKYDEKATKRYFDSILRDEKDKRITEDESTILQNEHFDHKDQVLEEVFEEYKGIINYDEIISEKNTYPRALEFVNYLYRCGRYSKVYILTHCNVEREVVAKKAFVERNWPGMELIAVPFHKEKYKVGLKRQITSKADYFMEVTGLKDLRMTTLIDDSSNNGKNWKQKGGIYIRYSPDTLKDYKNKELATLFPFDVMVMSDPEILKLGKGRR